MLNPRWKKVLADLWVNKTRTLLVAISIAIGVFAVGMIAESRERMLRGLSDGYLAGKPFSAVLVTKEPFGDDLIEAVRDMPNVEDADARNTVMVRLKVGPNKWKDLQLYAIDDFQDIRIGKMKLERGPWPPPDKEMLIERSALSPMLGVNMQVGDLLTIETLEQKERRIRVAGVVHDLSVAPTFIFNTYYGYITLDTLEWLGESRDYNSIRIRVDEAHFYDKDFVTRVAHEVRDKIERGGREVERMFMPPEPGKSPIATFALDPIIFILSALGVLSVFLSGFLVTNTLSGLLAQQLKQIGIMKAIGAQNGQIMSMYLVLVVCFGLLALFIGAPLGYIGAGAFAGFFSGLFNFDAKSYGIIPSVLGLELFVSIVVPICSAIQPVMKGTGITIREALSSESGPGGYGASALDRMMERIRGLPRPVLLSLRNTFRRKGRLALTLITLTLGGAIFIGVFSVQESVQRSLDELFAALVRFHITVEFDRPYRTNRIEEEALHVPGVIKAESWGSVTARRIRPDDTESEAIIFQAPASGSRLLDPEVVAGRWLLPNDENGIVLSLGVVDDEPDIRVGDSITLKLKGRETDWKVVGLFKALGNDSLIAYANYPYFAREVREAGESSTLNIVTAYEQYDRPNQEHVAQSLEQHFKAVGLRVSSSSTAVSEYDSAVSRFNIIVYCLLVMAVLIALVGGVGLMGTMSMNVLERTREIGVMRAIGASDRSILQIVIAEGLMIGMMSWILGAALAFPISKLLSDGVGLLFLGSPLSYTYSTSWALLWLALSLGLSALASFVPAWNASRLTVRDVLSYE